nr:ABC transporter ATP-binding protein [uncultured Lachnoclostridium sp.]
MAEKNKTKISYILLWSLKKIKAFKIEFLLNLLLGFALTALNLVIVYQTQMAIQNVTKEKDKFIKSIIFLISFTLVQILFQSIQSYIGGRLSAKVAFSMKEKFNKKIVSLPKSSKDKLNSGDVISIFNYDLNVITDFVPGGLNNTIFQVVMALIAAIYLSFINWKLLVVSMIFLPIAMYILNILQNKMGDYFQVDSESRGKSNIVATETTQNMYLVKSYNMQNLMCNKISEFYKGSLDSWINIHKIFSPILMLTIMLRQFPKFTCICFGGWLAINGQLRLEELIGFVMLLDYVISPIISIPQIIVMLTSAGTSIKRVDSVLALSDERTNGENVDQFENNTTLLEAENVSFGYIENKNVLNNISFKLRQGEQVALVGKSGCGKSSIIKLITGDFEVNSGSFRLYGQPYNMLSLKSIRNKMALVSQDVTIFPLSISENIAIGSAEENISQERIIEAAKLAGAHQFIMKLPEGYSTMLDENGVNLSGGERQMISIARAFLKDAPIVLLDEPTSSLDAQSENTINESIKRLVHNKGVIIISHRLSSIIQSDKILLIKEGCIIDEGNHTELLEKNEYYKNIYLYDITHDKEEVS